MEFVNVVIPPLAQTLTYSVPAVLQSTVQVGDRVSLPLGRRLTTGFIVGPGEPDPAFSIKPLAERPAPLPCFTAGQLSFFSWVADYYGDPLSNVIDVAVPPAAPAQIRREVRLVCTPDPLPRGAMQRRILATLAEHGGSLDYGELLRIHRSGSAAVKSLCTAGNLTITGHELVEPLPAAAAPWARTEVTLNEAQTAALEHITAAIEREEFSPVLLHGVTGSGKTEVYIEAIQACLARGRGVITVVPEIALTPQLIDRFQARLGDTVAVLHSGLSRRSRWGSWQALLAGRAMVAIGARSAVFAPVTRPGLIIVDEEHDDPGARDGRECRGGSLYAVAARGPARRLPAAEGRAR